jgi:hypothetical protein
MEGGEAAMTGQERPWPVITPFRRQGIISWAFGARLAAPSLAAAVTIVTAAPHRGTQTPVAQQLVWQLWPEGHWRSSLHAVPPPSHNPAAKHVCWPSVLKKHSHPLPAAPHRACAAHIADLPQPRHLPWRQRLLQH